MNLVKKNWHQNVMAALELAREAVQDADKQIREAGGKEMTSGDKKVARLALAYSDKLDGFMFELEKVGDKWQSIQEAIDGDMPEVQEVVLPTKVRATKGGFTRKVYEVAPWTNFVATMNGCVRIEEPTAKAAFAKALAYFDLEKVAKLGVMLNGEPLVSLDRSVFKKYPQSVASVKDGWYASTYCSTATKVQFVREFARRFGVKAEVEIIPHKMKSGMRSAEDVRKPVKMSRPPKSLKDGRVVAGVPYKVSEVVCAVMPVVFQRKLITQAEIDILLTKAASREFRTGGWAPLRRNKGNDADRFSYYDGGRRSSRYYSPDRVSLEFNGKKYYLTSQFCPGALTPVVKWFERKGLTRRSIVEMVEIAKRK